MGEETKSKEEVLKEVAELRSELAKAKAQVSALERELNDFAYVVSHDLRAPLRAVSQLGSWIAEDQREALDDNGKEMIDLMLGRLERLDGLLEAILQFSRIGRIQEALSEVDLDSMVRQIIEDVGASREISITIQKTLPVVRAERTRMEQLFKNLIENALKFMDKPDGRVSIDYEDDGSHWKFSVSDNGPGIHEQYHEKIFQPFQTLAPRDEFESTGMGLTLVKKIVHVSGGQVFLESELGKGSTFRVTLPKNGVPQ